MNRDHWPSVTQVLSPFFRADKIPVDVLEAAQKRGSDAHQRCEAYAKGLWLKNSSESITGYFESFKAWFDKYVEKVIYAEEAFYDDTYRFKGHPDFVCVMKGEPTISVVVDYKTPVGALKTWELQLAGYRHLVMEDILIHGYSRKCRSMALQLDADGKPAKAITYDDSPLALNIFLGYVQGWHWQND